MLGTNSIKKYINEKKGSREVYRTECNHVRTAHNTDICSYSAICVHKYKHYIPKAHLHTLVTERRTAYEVQIHNVYKMNINMYDDQSVR